MAAAEYILQGDEQLLQLSRPSQSSVRRESDSVPCEFVNEFVQRLSVLLILPRRVLHCVDWLVGSVCSDSPVGSYLYRRYARGTPSVLGHASDVFLGRHGLHWPSAARSSGVHGLLLVREDVGVMLYVVCLELWISICSIVVMFHYYWRIRKPWSPSIMLINNNIVARCT